MFFLYRVSFRVFLCQKRGWILPRVHKCPVPKKRRVCFWFPLLPSGVLWFPLVPSLWFSLVFPGSSGSLWFPLFVSLWFSLIFSGSPWFSLVLPGSLRFPLVPSLWFVLILPVLRPGFPSGSPWFHRFPFSFDVRFHDSFRFYVFVFFFRLRVRFRFLFRCPFRFRLSLSSRSVGLRVWSSGATLIAPSYLV